MCGLVVYMSLFVCVINKEGGQYFRNLGAVDISIFVSFKLSDYYRDQIEMKVKTVI